LWSASTFNIKIKYIQAFKLHPADLAEKCNKLDQYIISKDIFPIFFESIPQKRVVDRPISNKKYSKFKHGLFLM